MTLCSAGSSKFKFTFTFAFHLFGQCKSNKLHLHLTRRKKNINQSDKFSLFLIIPEILELSYVLPEQPQFAWR